MDLYLHIGTEKTGTSAIQRFFAANGQALAGMGVRYPEPGREMKDIGFMSAALQAAAEKSGGDAESGLRKAREALLVQVASALAAGTARFAVISEELLSSRLLCEREVAWLKDVLSRYFEAIRVIVYVRRQDEFLLSSYSTSIKSGREFALSLPDERTMRLRYDHWELLSRWSRVFGRERIQCRKFERTFLKSADIVDDFLDVLGMDVRPPLRRIKARNESLDAECLEFLRVFNRHNPGGTNRFDPVRGRIVSLLTGISNGPLPTLPERDLAQFMEAFRDSNARVAREFFGGVRSGPGDPLFESSSDPRPRTGSVTLTADRAIEICAKLFSLDRTKLDKASPREGTKRPSRALRRRARRAKRPAAPARTLEEAAE